MKQKLFHKYLVIISAFLLLLVGSLKIHALFFVKDVSDWDFQSLQKLNANQKNFSFAVLGDNKNSIGTFNSLINKINNNDVMFAVDNGDLVYDGEKEKYRFFIDQISRFKKPLLTVIGNHEIRENGNGIYYNYFGRPYYSFTIGNSCFIVLDDSNEKSIDKWQLDWLKKELNNSQSYKNRFVFMHVPLYDPREGDYKQGHSLEDLKMVNTLNDLFDKYKVTMVFASHIHSYYEGKWHNTPYIISGGGGAELAGADPKHDFYHYIKVDVKNDKVSYEVVKINSPPNEMLDRLLNDAWIYVYAFVAIHYLDLILGILLVYLATYIVLINSKTNYKNYLGRGKTDNL